MMTKNNESKSSSLDSRHRGLIYRVLQVVAILSIFLIPFIKTENGNSLLRFDIPSLSIHAFNRIVEFSNFFNIFLAIILFTFLFLLTTQLLGRVWCGWLCPQSFAAIRIERYISKFKNKSGKWLVLFLSSFFYAFMITLSWVLYFVSPYELFNTVQNSSVFNTIFIVIFLFLFFDFLIVRFKWCKYICPYSKFQVVLTDDDTLYVGMLKGRDSECLKCNSCIKVCPTKIDPRLNPNADCIYCETCVTACNKVFKKARKGDVGVLGYVWGKEGKFKLRANLILTGIVSLILAVVLIFRVVNDAPVVLKYESIECAENECKISANFSNKTNRPIRVHLMAVEGDSLEVETDFDNNAGLPVFADQSELGSFTIKNIDNRDEVNLFLEYKYDKEPILIKIKLKK